MLQALAFAHDVYAIRTANDRNAVWLRDLSFSEAPDLLRLERVLAVGRNGTRLALLQAEVFPMHIPSSLKITALGLALSSAAFAQSPIPAPPTPPLVPPASDSSAQRLSMVTHTSRVRAFNAGPGGDVRSLYLQNGEVVDLAPDLAGQVGQAIRKGKQVTVTGTKLEINGQSLVEAASIRLNGQTFSASPGAATLAAGAVPPPPGAPQAPPPPPRRRDRAAAPAPCGLSANVPPPPPGPGAPPPPPPGGITPPPPPPDGIAPPPPPPQN